MTDATYTYVPAPHTVLSRVLQKSLRVEAALDFARLLGRWRQAAECLGQAGMFRSREATRTQRLRNCKPCFQLAEKPSAYACGCLDLCPWCWGRKRVMPILEVLLALHPGGARYRSLPEGGARGPGCTLTVWRQRSFWGSVGAAADLLRARAFLDYWGVLTSTPRSGQRGDPVGLPGGLGSLLLAGVRYPRRHEGCCRLELRLALLAETGSPAHWLPRCQIPRVPWRDLTLTGPEAPGPQEQLQALGELTAHLASYPRRVLQDLEDPGCARRYVQLTEANYRLRFYRRSGVLGNDASGSSSSQGESDHGSQDPADS